MKLKEYIFHYIRKKQPERSPRFPHLEEPLKILVIYESDLLERNDAIKSIRQDLLRRKMDVTMWGYAEKDEITTLILPQSRILGRNDYTLLGYPREHIISDLQAEHYDLMLDLTTHPLLQLRYLAMYARADFKAGLNLGEGLHDMLISPPDLNTDEARPEATWLFGLLMQYLTTIKSND